MIEIPYKQFSQEVHNLRDCKRIPLRGSFDLTYRCNLKCVHCLTAGNQVKEELTKEDLFRIVDEAVEEGCLWMLLTGGEPLLREDFFDIYTYIKKKGVFITLFTNGTLITPEIADYFAKWRPFCVEITLHSINKAVFENITGVAGSFEKCIRGVELLLERNIALDFKSMVMTLNKHDIEAVTKYAKSLNIPYRFSPVIEPKADGSKEPLQFRIRPKEAVELESRFDRYRRAYEKECETLGARDSDNLFVCTPGLFSFHLDAYGQLMPCSMLPQYSRDLRKVSFASSWPGLYEEIREKKAAKNYPCLGCKAERLCGDCPGLFIRETGCEDKVSEFCCELGQRRIERFKRR